MILLIMGLSFIATIGCLYFSLFGAQNPKLVFDYVIHVIKFKLIDYLQLTISIDSKTNTIHIPYYKGDELFKVVVPIKRGVKPIKYLSIKCLHAESLQENREWNKRITQYSGPFRDFHTIPTTPSMLGLRDPLVVIYNDNTTKEFEIKDIIDVSVQSLTKSKVKSEKIDYNDGYSFFPIQQPLLIKFYDEQKKAHWVPADIDMRQDRQDLEAQDLDIQESVIGIIAFFTPSDGYVNENLFENFQRDTSFWKEARAFYAAQAFMETIHSEMYSLMALTIIRDPVKLNDIYYADRTYPCVKRIAQFMKKFMDSSIPLADRIIAFACIEGILFNSAFAFIYWLKKRNILRGFTKANEFIARDEGIHTRFAVALYLLASKESRIVPAALGRAHEIVEEAVNVNIQFINDILKVDRIGMNAPELILYTKCTADALLESLDHRKLYNVENPFDWMAIISLPNKTNFFEDKVSEYTQQIEAEFVFDENAYF